MSFFYLHVSWVLFLLIRTAFFELDCLDANVFCVGEDQEYQNLTSALDSLGENNQKILIFEGSYIITEKLSLSTSNGFPDGIEIRPYENANVNITIASPGTGSLRSDSGIYLYVDNWHIHQGNGHLTVTCTMNVTMINSVFCMSIMKRCSLGPLEIYVDNSYARFLHVDVVDGMLLDGIIFTAKEGESLTINHFQISGNPSTQTFFPHGYALWIRNCIFLFEIGFPGVRISNAKYVIIENSYFIAVKEKYYPSIYLYSGNSNILIQNNIFHRKTTFLDAVGEIRVSTSGVIIQNNLFTCYAPQNSVIISFVTQAWGIIQNNYFKNECYNTIFGPCGDCGNMTIRHNYVEDNTSTLATSPSQFKLFSDNKGVAPMDFHEGDEYPLPHFYPISNYEYGVAYPESPNLDFNGGTRGSPPIIGPLERYYFDCFGINNMNSSVCSSRGPCVSTDKCQCPSFTGGNDCSDHICNGYSYRNSSVCSGSGTCDLSIVDDIYNTSCSCNVTYYGNICQERIHRAYYESTNVIVVEHCISKEYISIVPGETAISSCGDHLTSTTNNGFYVCSWSFNDNSDKTTKMSIILRQGHEPVLYLEIIQLTNPSNYVRLNVEKLPFEWIQLLLWIIIPIASLFFIIVVLFLIIIISVLFIVLLVGYCKQRKTLDKVKELDDADLQTMIDEKRASKIEEGVEAFAKLKINRDLFKIDVDDIKVKKSIGKGAFGMVYRAVWADQEVAYKVFSTSLMANSQNDFDQFEKELSLFSSISHPNIVSFFGAVLKPPRCGIVMELCSLGDLNSYIKSKDVSLKEKIRILCGVASAMKFIHSKNILHRDLKGENILLTEKIIPKLVDFGLSKLVDEKNKEKTKFVGTSGYMAPEVYTSQIYDSKVDVYSYTIMMYCVLSENFNPYGKETYGIESKVAQSEEFRPSFKKMSLEVAGEKWIFEMIKRNWSHDPEKRDSFDDIYKEMKEKMKDLKD